MDRSTAVSQCICAMCPTYFECGETIAYCLADAGKSKCITTESGCICTGCSVQEALKFTHVFYCTKGSEKEILNGTIS
jgi:hypothetical protein